MTSALSEVTLAPGSLGRRAHCYVGSAGGYVAIYGHLMPDMEDRTRKAIDGAWSAAQSSSGGVCTAQGRPE